MNKNIGCGAGAPQGGKGLETMKRAVCFSPIVRRLCALLALGGLTCLLCACSMGAEDPGAEVALGSTDLLYEDGHVSGELCEGVVVDADIPDLSAVTSYDIVSAHLILPDEDVIQSMRDYVFAGRSEDEIQYEYETAEDGKSKRYQLYYIGEATEETYYDRVLSVHSYPDSKHMHFSNYEAYPYERIGYSNDIPVSEDSLFGPFAEQRDLSFLPREEAVDAVRAQLAEWEIETIGEPLVFCMDGEGMYQLLTELYDEKNRPPVPLDETRKEELEYYYMVFDVGYQNIPYTRFDFQSKSSALPGYGARVYVMYCAQGIVDLEYSWANYAIDGTLEEHDAAITLDQALSQVRTRYEDLVVTSAVEIENIFFQYVPAPWDETSGSCTFVPAWVFQPKTSMTVDGEVSEFYQKIVVVHAITGEVISL